MKVLSLFSGIGAFEKALTNMGVNYELVNYCEIDEYASKSYAAIHGVPESKNLGDITTVDTGKLPDDIDLITYGFPCQDISLAGKQRGFEHKGERTRSGLFFEALRLIEDLQPKLAICENVKNLTGKKFTNEFQIVLESLKEAGYKNYWKVLNAKDYGIPQNRERVFIVSIREDIDKGYEFPKPYELKLRLKDMLDAEVDEKYYLSRLRDFFIKNSFVQEKKGNGFRFSPHVKNNADIAKTITTYNGGRMDDNFILDIDSDDPFFKFDSTNAIAVREATKLGYAEAYEGDSIYLEQPNSKTRRGRASKGAAQTLTTSPQQATVLPQLRIRKLTPKECFRLMGFDDEDYYAAEKVNSNTQLYKQAGNSIVIDVIEEIYEELFKLYWNEVS